MQTTSVYHGFALRQEALNQRVVQTVRAAAAAAERVWLLGLTLNHRRTESLFSRPSATRQSVNGYWLLVVVPEDGRSRNNLQDGLESRLYPLVPTTVIVLSAVQFGAWLAEGHPFAVAVHGRGFVLYQKEGAEVLPFGEVDGNGLTASNARLFAQTKNNVQEFLAGAELYTVRVQYKLAAFLLHQAAEQALRALLMLHTGLRLNTHSIDRLVRCCSLFCYKLPDLFAGNTDKDKRLFRLLQDAYVDSRYKEDYCIKGENVQLLTGKVKALYGLFLEWGVGTNVKKDERLTL